MNYNYTNNAYWLLRLRLLPGPGLISNIV